MAVRFALGLLMCVGLAGAIAGNAEAQRRRRREPPPEPTTGTVVVHVAEAGAEIFIDEVPLGESPLEPVEQRVGAHTLRVRLPGYTEYTDIIHVEAGGILDVEVALLPLSYVLEVSTEPAGAHVFVDGNYLGDSPVELDVVEGSHSLRITHPGYQESVRSVEAVAGARDSLSIELEPIVVRTAAEPESTEWYEEPVTWIAIGSGVAVAAAIVVTVLVVTGDSDASKLDQFCMDNCVRIETRW